MRYSPTIHKRYKWTEKQVELSIITVNYNGFKDTCQLIESIRKHIRSVRYEIIVVDNASVRNEAHMLQEQYSFIRVLRSEVNRGFAGGNNLGIPVAQGKYVFFLNNDTYVTDDHFRDLINALESHPNAAAVSPLIRYANDDSQPVQFAGFTPLTRYTLRNSGKGVGDVNIEKYMTSSQNPYLHGAAMLVKREALCNVGVLPEMYFLYFEELDWSESLVRSGYTLHYEPCCTIYHKESQSTGVNSPLKIFYMTRNRFLFAYRNRTVTERYICYLYLLCIVLPRDVFRHLAYFHFQHAKAAVRGVQAYFKLKKEQKEDKHDIQFSYYLP